jgi:hypothetical protein
MATFSILQQVDTLKLLSTDDALVRFKEQVRKVELFW